MRLYSTQRWDNKEELQTERGHVGIHTITGERAGIRGRGRVIPEEAYIRSRNISEQYCKRC